VIFYRINDAEIAGWQGTQTSSNNPHILIYDNLKTILQEERRISAKKQQATSQPNSQRVTSGERG